MKKVKIGIVWANPLSANLGVGALAWGLANLIEKASAAVGRVSEIHFFGCTQTGVTQIPLNGCPITVEMHGYHDYSSLRAFARALLRRRPGARELLDMDCILDLGEGDSFSDLYGQTRLDSLLATKRFCAAFGRRVALMPQTIGPFQGRKNRVRAGVSLKMMHPRFARDSASVDQAKSLPFKPTVEESIDVAFALDFPRAETVPGLGIRVGLNVSGLLWNGGYNRSNDYGLSLDYKTLIQSLLNAAMDNPSVELFLVPHVFGSNCPEVEDDLLVSRQLITTFAHPRLRLAPEYSNPAGAKAFIATLSAFAGARMHACIAAHSTGTAVLPMAYSRKFNGLFCQTLKYPLLLDMTKASVVDGVSMWERLISERTQWAQFAREAVEEIVQPRLNRLIEVLGRAIHET